jgi:hypothetical protein
LSLTLSLPAIQHRQIRNSDLQGFSSPVTDSNRRPPFHEREEGADPCANHGSSAALRSSPVAANRRVLQRRATLVRRAVLAPLSSGARTLAQARDLSSGLAHVFDVVREPQPRMSPLLPDRPRRRREGRIRERAHRDGHNSRRGLRGVEHGRRSPDKSGRRISLHRLRRGCTAESGPQSLPVPRRIALGHRRRFRFDAGTRDSGRSRLEPAPPRR